MPCSIFPLIYMFRLVEVEALAKIFLLAQFVAH